MLKSILGNIHALNAKRELARNTPLFRVAAENLNAEELVDLIYSSRWERFFWTKQVIEEFKALAKVVEELRPKVVVEVGTNTGGTLFVFTRLAAPDGKIISIDLPEGRGGGGYPQYKTDFFKSFAAPTQNSFFIRADSHLPSTRESLLTILGEDEIDFLFLDGDHTLEGIKMDFEMYAPKVRKGGIIAFHDIKNYPHDHWIQVHRFGMKSKRNSLIRNF